MMPFGDKTVTLYNRYRGVDANGRTVTSWFPHVLTGCFWGNAFGKSIVGEVELSKNVIVCKIPHSENYLPYTEWAASGVDRAEAFTLCPDDIIVLGAVTDVIGNNMTVNQLKEKYAMSGVMTVMSASDNTGRPLPHYAAKGV